MGEAQPEVEPIIQLLMLVTGRKVLTSWQTGQTGHLEAKRHPVIAAHIKWHKQAAGRASTFSSNLRVQSSRNARNRSGNPVNLQLFLTSPLVSEAFVVLSTGHVVVFIRHSDTDAACVHRLRRPWDSNKNSMRSWDVHQCWRIISFTWSKYGFPWMPWAM